MEYNLDNYLDFFEGRADGTIIKQMYQNVDAILDQPSCNVWHNILQQFPDAKVILTVRDSEDEWFKSYKGTISGSYHGFLRKVIIVSINFENFT